MFPGRMVEAMGMRNKPGGSIMGDSDMVVWIMQQREGAQDCTHLNWAQGENTRR